MSIIYLKKEQILFHHVAAPCFQRSPEWTNQAMVTLKYGHIMLIKSILAPNLNIFKLLEPEHIFLHSVLILV